jgi:predicted GNAT family N-acyltransferase
VNHDIAIQFAVSADEREAAFRLRHDVYVREMGFRQPCTDSARRLVDPFDDTAILLIARIGDTVVGTLRSNFGVNSDLGPFVEIHRMRRLDGLFPARVSLTSRLIVRRDCRGVGVAGCLAHVLFQIGVAHGIAVDFIDCEARLVPFYRRLGYEQTEDPYVHPEFGPRIPMHLWTDCDYLKRAGSPLVRVQ